ncbi:MAG: thiol peroxidase [bacterium]
MPVERKSTTMMKGGPVTLVGNEVRVGSRAPEFNLVDSDNKSVTLSSLGNKTRILLSVPSLETSVCDLEVREFSRRADKLPNTVILVVSVDLPLAQKRWCGAAGVHNLVVASDHRDTSFGVAYGVLIKEPRWLARAAFVVNPAGEVTYAEYVPVLGEQPKYDAVVQAAKEAAAAPA